MLFGNTHLLSHSSHFASTTIPIPYTPLHPHIFHLASVQQKVFWLAHTGLLTNSFHVILIATLSICHSHTKHMLSGNTHLLSHSSHFAPTTIQPLTCHSIPTYSILLPFSKTYSGLLTQASSNSFQATLKSAIPTPNTAGR